MPSGSFSSCSTLASVPVSKIASVAGSSSEAFFCVASRMNVSERITSSSALIDFSRPTKQRHDHVREDHDVAQRQHPDRPGFRRVAAGVVVLAVVMALSPCCCAPAVMTRGCGIRNGVPKVGQERKRRPREAP